MRRDDEREIAGDGIGRALAHGYEVETELGAEREDRGRDRRVAHDEHPGSREHRLEEDLDGASGEARVLGRHGSLLDFDLATGGRIFAGWPVGNDAQQNCLLGLKRFQRVHANALLRAHAADEPLDRPVAEDECHISRLDARRALRADDRRGHERRARCCELPCSLREGLGHHCGGTVTAEALPGPALRPRPWQACRACRCGRRRVSRAARR